MKTQITGIAVASAALFAAAMAVADIDIVAKTDAGAAKHKIGRAHV